MFQTCCGKKSTKILLSGMVAVEAAGPVDVKAYVKMAQNYYQVLAIFLVTLPSL
jgi:hypothetical protein